MPPTVHLLGGAELELDGDRHPLPRDKRGALLVVLAESGDWIDRERLAFLFWPDRSDGEARRNLRQLLRRLKGLPHAAGVEVGREQLRWRVESDVAAFRAALEADDWRGAIRGALPPQVLPC